MRKVYEHQLKKQSTYTAFGLTVVSDLELPELLPTHLESANVIDIQIKKHSTLSPQDNSRESFSFNIPGVGQFSIRSGKVIHYAPAPDANEAGLRLFLLGSCMGALLQQRGYLVLHGNAISYDKVSCEIFVGHSGAGKSTLAAWHYLQGATILADDVCLISFDEAGTAYVTPSYPQLKLWQTSADLLAINTNNLRQIRPEEPKYALPIQHQFAKQPLPIKQITEIQPNAKQVSQLTGVHKVVSLIENSYRYHFLHAMSLTTRYNKKLLRLAHSAPVTRAPRKLLHTSLQPYDCSQADSQ